MPVCYYYCKKEQNNPNKTRLRKLQSTITNLSLLMSHTDDGYVIKFVHDEHIRRVRVQFDEINFAKALKTAATLFHLSSESVKLQYLDDESEVIQILDSMDFAEAIRVAQSDGRSSLRLLVKSDGNLVKSDNISKTVTVKFENRHRQVSTSKLKQHQSMSKPDKPKLKKTNKTDNSTKQTAAKPSKSATKTSTAAAETKVDAKVLVPDPQLLCWSQGKHTAKPSKPVPLQTTSGGAKLFLDGTVEFGLGGDAFLRPDGTVSCVMHGNGFPSVTAQGVAVCSGKWYYEMTLLTSGCMQIGWATPNYTGSKFPVVV